jgi:hypothetical protein
MIVDLVRWALTAVILLAPAISAGLLTYERDTALPYVAPAILTVVQLTA